MSSRVLARLVNGLHILAGASPQDMARLDQRASIQYATLGLVMACGFLILAAAWIEVGLVYFGPVGVVVPGLLVPTVFVLGIDRLVAMGPRRLHGELASYSPDSHPWRAVELVFRVGSGMALSLLSVATFFLVLAAPSIQRLQAAEARQANQPLRAELVERIDNTHRLALAQANSRQAELDARLQGLVAEQTRLTAELAEVDRRARQSRDEAALEEGGLSGRVQGRGPRYVARERLAAQNAEAARELRRQLETVEAQHRQVDADLDKARQAAAQATLVRQQGLATLDTQIAADARFVPLARDIFADFAALLRLFRHPVDGPGFVVLGTLGFVVLFCLEMAPLLALALNPASPHDVLRIARNRELAAEVVAVCDLAVIQTHARIAAPLRVRPTAAGPHTRPSTEAGS